ncbi:MAG: PD-(D/E)XK nuclease family protein [Paludibacteraceae bacterium]|nr:PD-(D/E)XK nuclease family protein [Paludibacteraceae bacterium]
MMFLEELTENLISKYGLDGLGGLTIVFPTRRAALVVNGCIKTHLEQHDIRRPVQAPVMTTLSGLFDSLSTYGQEDELRLVSKLYDIYCRYAEHIPPLDVFYGWGRQLLQDFSMMDKGWPDLQPDAFLKNASAARRLEELELDEEVRSRLETLVAVNRNDNAAAGSSRRIFECLWESLPRMYADLQVAAGTRTYEGARMKKVLVDWNSDFVQKQLRGKMFVFAGFNYLVPAELELMRRLQSAGQALFYWDYPAAGTFSCNPKAFKWVQRNVEKVIKSNELPVRPWEPKDVELVTTTSVHAEAQFVWQWLKEHHHAGDRTGVVLCDETMLEQVISALPDAEEGDPRFARINITKGFPLKYTPVFAFVKNWLSDKSNDRAEDETWADVVRRLLTAVSEYGKVTPAEQENLVVTGEVTEEWSVLLSREAHYRMMLALNRFCSVVDDELAGKLRSLTALRLLLKRYLEGISLPFHGEPLTDIQIIGVLETRAMDFDNLLILNVEEGVVPQVGEDLSYFPFYLRKAYGMQTAEESTDVYAYNFFRLMRRARHVTLTYCGSESKNNRKTMSRFVMQMLASNDFNIRKFALNERNEMRPPVCQQPDNQENSSLLSLLHPGEDGMLCRPDGKVMRLSPSALNTYRTCPMEFYLAYVKGIRPEEETGDLLSRAELGRLVHQTIQCLYEHLNGGRIEQPMHVTEEMIDNVADGLLEEMLGRSYCVLNEEWEREHKGEVCHYMKEQHAVENLTVLHYVRHILSADRLAAEKGLRILALERDCSFVIELPEIGKIRVGGRADRIDMLGGQVRIVDYKTGSADVSKLRIPPAETEEDSIKELFVQSDKPGYQLQTLIYSEAYSAQKNGDTAVLPVVYFVREQGEDIAQSVTMNNAPLDYSRVRQVFLDTLTEYAGMILTDTEHRRAEEGHCDPYCPFYMLCDRQKKDF